MYDSVQTVVQVCCFSLSAQRLSWLLLFAPIEKFNRVLFAYTTSLYLPLTRGIPLRPVYSSSGSLGRPRAARAPSEPVASCRTPGRRVFCPYLHEPPKAALKAASLSHMSTRCLVLPFRCSGSLHVRFSLNRGIPRRHVEQTESGQSPSHLDELHRVDFRPVPSSRPVPP